MDEDSTPADDDGLDRVENPLDEVEPSDTAEREASDSLSLVFGTPTGSPIGAEPPTPPEFDVSTKDSGHEPNVTCGFMTEKRPGDGEDSLPFEHTWTTDSGRRSLIAVFDGMGGSGSASVPSPDDPTVHKTMAFLASRAARQAFERASNQITASQHSGEIRRMLEAAVATELNGLVARPGGVPDSRLKGKTVKKYPTTVAAAQIEDLADGSRRVQCMWAGDSRVFALFPDDRLLKQLTSDHNAHSSLDGAGDAALTRHLGPESTELDHLDYELPREALVIAATDGCFAYRSLKLFLISLLEQLDRARNQQDFAQRLAVDLSSVSGDDCSMVISFGPQIEFSESQELFRPYLRDLQDLRNIPLSNPHVTLHKNDFYVFEKAEENQT